MYIFLNFVNNKSMKKFCLFFTLFLVSLGFITNISCRHQINNKYLSDNYNYCYYENKSKDEQWFVTIKKSNLLNFFKNKGISINNISDIKTVYDDNGNFCSINIAGNTISFEELQNSFNINSSKITKIENKNSEIIIKGYY